MANPRGRWSTWLDFFFSLTGSMVGLGNIWRFPYICFQSGGAAFLIPYAISMALCGMPILLLELSYCQYSNLGPGKVWVACPLFQGIGYGMVLSTAIVYTYYNVILAWALFYMAVSFKQVLPWTSCDNEWNTELCQTKAIQQNTSQRSNNVSTDSGLTNVLQSSLLNQTVTAENRTVTAAEEYWRLQVLQMSSGISEPGKIQWQLLLCLFVAWLLVFLSLIKGIKSSGKVVYVTATLPYIILTTLLIRGCFLPGAVDGIKYYVVPQWEKLLDTQVWRNAAAQVIYSIGIGFGGISTLASYNRFHNNCYRDALIFPVVDFLTSWFAGCIISVYLGYMANQASVHVSEVVSEGPGLAFMAYPSAVATMPLPQMWSVLFFLLLFTVGLDTQFVSVEIIVTALTDIFPKSLGHRKLLVTASVCVTGFILGISYVTQGGIFVLTLMDWYLGSFTIMCLAVFEILVMAWIYGVSRLYDDIALMIGYRIPAIWKPMWLVVSPLFILSLLVAGLVNFAPVNVGGQGYPPWAEAIGWIIGIIPILPIPIVMAVVIWREDGDTLKQKIIHATKPRKTWRPAIDRDVGGQGNSCEEQRALNDLEPVVQSQLSGTSVSDNYNQTAESFLFTDSRMSWPQNRLETDPTQDLVPLRSLSQL